MNEPLQQATRRAIDAFMNEAHLPDTDSVQLAITFVGAIIVGTLQPLKGDPAALAEGQEVMVKALALAIQFLGGPDEVQH